MALNSQIQAYQILTKDDEVCNTRLSSILIAVPADEHLECKIIWALVFQVCNIFHVLEII